MLRSCSWVVAALFAQGAMRIAINIPAYRMDVYADTTIVRTVRVAVGARGFETPRGEFRISRIEWNPWWIPPDSPWAAKEKPQPPGPGNPMGAVKLYFQPEYFLHGTPLENSLGSAVSHGCVRMADSDAVAVAQLLENAEGAASLSEAPARLTSDTVATRVVPLPAAVPLAIRYDLAELRRDTVWVYRDIYRLARRSLRAELLATLAGAGVDTTSLDRAKVRALITRVTARGSAMPLRDLLRRAPPLPVAARDQRVGRGP